MEDTDLSRYWYLQRKKGGQIVCAALKVIRVHIFILLMFFFSLSPEFEHALHKKPG